MATVDAQTIWELVGALSGDKSVGELQRTADVTRIDRDGTVWVHMEGGADETPVRNISADVQVGDTVTVQWGSNAVSVTGNSTAPATSARGVAQQTAPVRLAAEAAERDARASANVASEARAVAEATNQHFWTRSENDDTDGAGAGAFVTDMPQDDWLAGAADGFSDLTDDKPYANFLLNSLGGLIRRGKTRLAQFTKSAVAFYDGVEPEGDEEQVELASFGIEGARIGPSTGQHVVIDENGMSIYGSEENNLPSMYFSATADGIEMKNSDSEIRQVLTNNRNSFRTDDGDIAWFGQSDQGVWEMHIGTTYAEDMIRFGNYAWIKRNNGNMTIKWLGGGE